MSNELRVTLQADISNTANAFKWQWRPASLSVDLTNTLSSGAVQHIGTTQEAIALSGDVATAGFARFQHVGTTGYVDIACGATNATNYFARLYSNQVCITFLQNTALGAIASATNVPLAWDVFAR